VNKLFIDFETYWDKDHTLSKMNAIEYVMHPKTEIQSAAIKVNAQPTRVIFGEDNLRKLFNRIDWGDTWAIGHNMELFDSLILAYRFGVAPKLWGCTLAMSRPIYAKEVGGSLKAVAAALGLGDKLSIAATNTKGKRLADFSDLDRALMGEYNKVDTELCAGIFNALLPQYTPAELVTLDATIRMVTEPKFEADMPLLEHTLGAVQRDKARQLTEVAQLVGVDASDPTVDVSAEVKKQLMSAAKFKKVLEGLGVEVPMKVSPTTGKEIPALSKTDEAFVAMQEHEDERVQMLALARLGAKSTILETRLKAFIDVSRATGGAIPVPLKYYGADTTGRWSGTMYNPQNLPRINPSKPKLSDALRKSMRAPKGHKVVVADLSGIELRVNHFLWKVPSSMALFEADPEKADLYKDFAAKLYAIKVEEVNKDQRQIGKLAHLGLGYGAGAPTFRSVAKMMGGVSLSDDESKAIVNRWRNTYSEIVNGWRTCHKALDTIFAGLRGNPIDPWGMCLPCDEGIRTPKGLIRYPNLRREFDGNGKPEWVYGTGSKKARIYAGKITENCVQHLARQVLVDQMVEIRRATSLSPALTVHDELVYVVPEADAEGMLDYVNSVMRTPPDWWPALVTWSEGDIADSYGEAK